MIYKIIRNTEYDFIGQSYSSEYPNLHKYPATMLPQIGIKVLKEFNINKGKLLDPYCGTGSSFASALEVGINEMYGYDINPLAVLISKVKFTKISFEMVDKAVHKLRNDIFEFLKNEDNFLKIDIPNIKNINYWFSKEVSQNLAILKYHIINVENKKIKDFFSIPFAETVRDCSYTRNNEFKLYRIKPDQIIAFNPDVFGIFFNKLKKALEIYKNIYYPKLQDNIKIEVECKKFLPQKNLFDIVLTSPPYGDSKTTVAYGQFSNFANEWLGVENARKIDSLLMGGKARKELFKNSIISEQLNKINSQAEKRSYEVSSYYFDLDFSIKKVANSVKKSGFSIYIVGNRTVKGETLLTDQFIAERFEKYGFKHIITYQRNIANKSMPSKNSPTNKIGAKRNTMNHEYIVICEKIS